MLRSCPAILRRRKTTWKSVLQSLASDPSMLDHRPDSAAQVAGFVLTTRLGNHAHNRLSIARPHMYPAVFPVEAQAIQFVRPCLRPAILERLKQFGQSSRVEI